MAKFPKELITVTPLSITLSVICFIFFMFLAFYLGTQYQRLKVLEEQQLKNAQSNTLMQQKLTTVTVSPSSSLPTQSVRKNSPSANAQGFYDWYTDCLNENNSQSCDYKTNEYVSAELNNRLTAYEKSFLVNCDSKVGCTHGDLILCAQNVPQSINVNNEKISGSTATVTVHTIYGVSGDNPLTVSLKNESGTWKLTNISCSKYSL